MAAPIEWRQHVPRRVDLLIEGAEELIGAGGQGAVFKVYSAKLGTHIAEKRLLPSAVNDRRACRAVEKEAKALQSLSGNDCLVQLVGYEPASEATPPKIFMELLSESVFVFFQRQGVEFRLFESHAKPWLFDALQGLLAIHDAGFIHRDLKPGNLLLTEQGRVKIGDLGIARDSIATLSTTRQDGKGTIGYMAPEVMLRDPPVYTPACDVWSLGCAWIFMLTGKQPWEDVATSEAGVRTLIQTQCPPLPPGLSPQARDVMAGMLCHDHTRRLTVAQLLTCEYFSDFVPRPSRDPPTTAVAPVAPRALGMSEPPSADRPPDDPPRAASVPPREARPHQRRSVQLGDASRTARDERPAPPARGAAGKQQPEVRGVPTRSTQAAKTVPAPVRPAPKQAPVNQAGSSNAQTPAAPATATQVRAGRPPWLAAGVVGTATFTLCLGGGLGLLAVMRRSGWVSERPFGLPARAIAAVFAAFTSQAAVLAQLAVGQASGALHGKSTAPAQPQAAGATVQTGITAPLHMASFAGLLDAVRNQVENNHASIHALDSVGDTALHNACHGGHLDVVKYLVEEARAPVDALGQQGATPLHIAAHNGHAHIVKYLVSARAAVDAVSSTGATPLRLACENGHIDVVRFLVEHARAAVSTADKEGTTALHAACMTGRIDVVRFLVEHARDAVSTAAKEGTTALHVASMTGHIDVVKCLVEAGATVDAVGMSMDVTPLLAACYAGQVEVVKYLVEDAHADVGAVAQNGASALHLVVQNGHLAVLRYLIDGVKMSANITDKGGNSLLHVAVLVGRGDMVRYLFEEAKVNVDVVNNEGLTPAALATKFGHSNVVDLLQGRAR